MTKNTITALFITLSSSTVSKIKLYH